MDTTGPTIVIRVSIIRLLTWSTKRCIISDVNSMIPHFTRNDSASSLDEYLEDTQTELNTSFEQYLEKIGLLVARDHQTLPDSTENAEQGEIQAPISEETGDNLWNQECGSEQEVWSHTEYPTISGSSDDHFNEEVYEEEHMNAQFQCETGETIHCNNETIYDIVQNEISDQHMANNEMASIQASDNESTARTSLQCNDNKENYIVVDQDTIYFNGQYYQRVDENAPMPEYHQQQYAGSSIGKMPRVLNHKAKEVRSQDPANTSGASHQCNQYERKGRKVAHPFTYLDLVSLACLNSPDGRVVPTEVYRFIERHYEGFRTKNSNWKNSVRHQLSHESPSHFVKEQTYGNVMSYRLADPDQTRKRLMACVSANGYQNHRVPQHIYDLIFSHEYAQRQSS